MSGVDRWPEDEADGEIDAIVGPYAIQHTSLDTLPDGRLADARYKQVVGDLESDLAGKLGFRLSIAWDWAAVRKGQDWRAIRDSLRHWIVNEAGNLEDGRHRVTNAAGCRLDLTLGRADPSGSMESYSRGTTPATSH